MTQGVTTIIRALPAAAVFTAAWTAVLSATQAAPLDGKDAATDALMDIEDMIDGAPVITMQDAAMKLRLALEMACRQGVDDDPAWLAVADALDYMQRTQASAF
jgi:hypothetical protein